MQSSITVSNRYIFGYPFLYSPLTVVFRRKSSSGYPSNLLKTPVSEVEKQLMKGARINTIAGFAAIKRLQKLMLDPQRDHADPVTIRLQYQFCPRSLQEYQY